MPNPFPGMNPYLEARSVWPDVHASIITYMREQLQPQIRPKYVARIGERLQLAQIGGSYVPDVLLVKGVREPAPTLIVDETTLPVDEPQLLDTLDEAYREPFIEIIARETGDVVTLIELLSPANKFGDGRDHYLQKQKDLQATSVNLVEIDLLSYGKTTVLARNTTITEPAEWRYLINISRNRQRHRLEVYAVPLRDRLPNCRIPLRPPDEDVVLDLTAVLNRTYDVGSYDLLIDYSQPPSVPLTEAEAAWLDQWLREKEIRT
jgi:hypothetical protein